MSPPQPPPKEVNVSEEVQHGSAWERSTRMPGDMVVGETSTTEDDSDHTGKTNVNRWLALTALAFMWTSAQAPLYLFAGAPVYIYRDLGGLSYWVWFITAHLLATAAIAPFVGALSDLVGRRYVAIIGSAIIIFGQIICGASIDMAMFIAGMGLTGIGTGINELTALAGTAELVPLSHRGYYIAGMVLTVLPFMPSAMYAQLIAAYSNWRYISIVTTGWAFAGIVLTILFYFPPPRARVQGWREKMALLKRTDFMGGFLSIVGLALFEVGILAGGYQFPWTSARTLAPLIIGICAIAAFVAWQLWGTANPMVPRNLSKAPRTLALTMIITFISGANFFSVLLLWPPEAYNVYGHEPVGVGLRGLPFAFGVFTGCIVSLVLLSRFRGGQIRYLILGASVLMTVGCGCMALATPHNMHAVYGILFVAGTGVGGITIPVSTVATIVCAGDVIATVTALTIAVRIVGGAVGYAVYLNVFVQRLVPELGALVGAACARAGVTDPVVVREIIELTAASLVKEIRGLPGVSDAAWLAIVAAGQQAYANAYPWVYYCSAVFGGAAVVASLFLGDISEMVDDTVTAAM
ncbi:major facilitator superfamily domain-containing protein [Chaetomium fimeti]|uniref:Major facilitator superfamily domain-containing protein n=1 Tax=Chaetomium fimeti TaxID=1854472 RepID=A0AAE0HKL7_9PEZI|nr:major facilitator superfamily domain-containing protein [Chaetomium fimeti]